MSVPPCGVYPGSGPRQCKSEAEARFYDQLRSQLPADHYAWHRIDVITNRGEQGEADFVVAKRGAGILVVEVKGGRIEERDGVWYQNGRKMDEAPLDQARRAAALIERRFIEVHKRPPPYECLTAFPDSEFESAPSNDYLRQRTLDANGVRYLREQITASFKLLPHFRHETEDDSWINFIHERLWGPIFKGMLSGLVQTDKSQREQLDDEQLKIIGELERNRRVIVEGPPGSGKTIIAVEVARRIADRSKPVFYLCFTEALAASVRSELEQTGVQAYAIKRLAEKFLQQAGKLQLEEIPAQMSTQSWH